nr:glycosyltransferase family 1 protein [uncultured Acetatifactor sp.]
MRILIINTVAFRLNGITSVIMNYFRNMDCKGMQIDFLSPNEMDENLKEEIHKMGANIYCVPRKSRVLNYMRKIYGLMKKNRYDIVHVHGNSAMMIIDFLPAVMAKIPIRIAHSHNTTCDHVDEHKMLNPIFKHCCTHRFACGKEAGEWLFQDKPFEIIPNGIDLKAFGYDGRIREKYRNFIQAGNKVVIGYVGNFNRQKNHGFLLDLFAELMATDKDYLLLLIGEGHMLASMKEKAHDLGIDGSVVFLGKTSEVQCYLQTMDVFVLPSLHEGMPLVLVEAQASGLPCIVSDVVTEEANLTSSIRYVPLNRTEAWVKAIRETRERALKEDRESLSEKWQGMIREAGYDIMSGARRLEGVYWEYYQLINKGER